MNSLFPDMQHIIYPLGWAIVHSLWQGLAIFLVLKTLLNLIPSKNAPARYWLSISAIGTLLAAFVYTFLYEYNNTVIILAGVQDTANGVVLPTAYNTGTDSLWIQLQSWYNQHTSMIVGLYLAGIALFLIRMFYNLFLISKLKTEQVAQPNKEWQQMLNNCIASLNISRHVRLLYSSKVSVPMVMGAIKPVILIPVALTTQLSTKEAESILLHELAHVKRNDYLFNIIQMFIETILFYNPFVWLISTEIRREREHCCDDVVIGKTDNKIPYVKALAALEEYRQYPAQPSLAAKNSKQHLLTRIKRIMEMRNNNINYSQLLAVMLTVVIMIAAVTFITPTVNAQTKKNKDTEQTDDKKDKKAAPASNANTSKGTDEKKNSGTKMTISIKSDEMQELEKDIEKETLKAVQQGMKAANKALEEIDLEEIIGAAFDKIDWDSIGNNIEMALDEVDWEEIQADIREAMEDSREAMADAREEMEEARKEMEKSRKSRSREIADANRQIAEASKQIAEASKRIAEARRMAAEASAEARRAGQMARAEANMARRNARQAADFARTGAKKAIVISSSHDHILNDMEKDGLIDRSKRYKVEKRGNTLYIDDIQQSREVYRKYGDRFKSKNVTIKSSPNSIKISLED